METALAIFQKILEEITPTDKNLALINDIVEILKNLLEKKAKEQNIDYTVIEPQGSTGIKQTQLKDDFDIDLFVGLPFDKFKPKYEGLSKNQLKKASKKDFLSLCNDWILKSLTMAEFKNARLLYAEHPYVTVEYVTQNVKIKIDIVLYFDLEVEFIRENGPITAVDRSPWHGRFIRDNLSSDQKNDVRLLKQFFKSCNSYGDKSAVGKVGFIGYSAELLIYHFGNIQKVFEGFNDLVDNPIDHFKRTQEELDEIIHFQNDNLIITDPIDSNRNVASAISEQAYKYCNQRIKDFSNNPSKSYFKIKSIPEMDISSIDDSKLSKMFIIETKNTNAEVHYTISRDKLHALGDSIVSNGEKEFNHAERFKKIIFEVYFEDKIDEYNLAIYCYRPEISQTYLRRGPPTREKTHVEKFKKKNPNHFVKDGFLWVESKRKYVNFLDFLKNMVIERIPENLDVLNISIALEAKTLSGKRTLYILENMILPFYI
jgi:tRNA CCA-adding enzyme